MPRQPGGILIAGVSARAFAESAVRAGFGCRSVDAFGDLDLKARVAAIGLQRDLGRRYSATAAAAVARGLEAAAVAYVANFENHPAAVRRLGAGRRLLGNPPDVLARARDPRALAALVRTVGERMPRMLAWGQPGPHSDVAEWLIKPVRGGGGSGVRPWQGEPLSTRQMLQERIRGTPASVVFLADGRHAQVLGMSRQLAGEPRFGARGFRYCGSIYPLAGPAAACRRVAALAEALTALLGLRGVNGIDFVLDQEEEPVVLELNPRFPASAELVERATDMSIFAAHLAACEGELATVPARRPGTWGKAIVYARRDMVVGSTREWLDRPDIRDVPFPGERIPAGAPVCSIFACDTDEAVCGARLEALAREIEGALRPADASAASSQPGD